MKKPLFSTPSDWEMLPHVGAFSGKLRNSYFFRGTKAHRFPIDNHFTKQLAGWVLIEKDIRNIQAWLRLLENLAESPAVKKSKKRTFHVIQGSREQTVQLKALLVAIITFYGKLFTEAKGRRVRMTEDHLTGEPELIEMHRELMVMRHSFAAHSGEDGHEEAEIIMLLDSKRHRLTRPVVAWELKQPNHVSHHDVAEYIKLTEHLRQKALGKMDKLTDRIYKEIGKKSYSDLYKMIGSVK